MALLTASERPFSMGIARLLQCNPFLPERIEAERQALGDGFVDSAAVWHRGSEGQPQSQNARRLRDRTESLVEVVRERLASGTHARADDLALYESLVVYALYTRYEDRLLGLIRVSDHAAPERVVFYEQFCEDLARLRSVVGTTRGHIAAPQLFALCFQIRRAFHVTFRNIIGGSMAAARLRGLVWQSIFTHNIQRYARSLYRRMEDITTLISGPSGTGKELVAQAIGLSRFVPFDPVKQVFVHNFSTAFRALNLSAIPATLVESELFGHRRGAFTGAVEDRSGWLEVSMPFGSVFLDEIGEVDLAVQAKLLRVLETRTFQRLGETRDRSFQGKFIAATNRNLLAEIQQHRFREDLYYRLCSDLIFTPSLRDQLRDSPDELPALLLFIARRVALDDEAEALAVETERWIRRRLGPDYGWPGNFRELEQCVRNVMVRGEYVPGELTTGRLRDRIVRDLAEGSATADQLLCAYCTLVYATTGSYLETARRLQLDRRTVKDKIEATFLARLRHEAIE